MFSVASLTMNNAQEDILMTHSCYSEIKYNVQKLKVASGQMYVETDIHLKHEVRTKTSSCHNGKDLVGMCMYVIIVHSIYRFYMHILEPWNFCEKIYGLHGVESQAI